MGDLGRFILPGDDGARQSFSNFFVSSMRVLLFSTAGMVRRMIRSILYKASK